MDAVRHACAATLIFVGAMFMLPFWFAASLIVWDAEGMRRCGQAVIDFIFETD